MSQESLAKLKEKTGNKNTKWTEKVWAIFKREVDITTRNTSSPKRCYSCIESKCLRERELEYTTTMGGPQPAIGKDYRAKTVKCPEEITLDTGERAYNTQTTRSGKHCLWVCKAYTLGNGKYNSRERRIQENAELCPIKEAGLEHDCNERMEFKTCEALALLNSKQNAHNTTRRISNNASATRGLQR